MCRLLVVTLSLHKLLTDTKKDLDARAKQLVAEAHSPQKKKQKRSTLPKKNSPRKKKATTKNNKKLVEIKRAEKEAQWLFGGKVRF